MFLGKRLEKAVNSLAMEVGVNTQEFTPKLARSRAEKNLKFSAERHFREGFAYNTFFDTADVSLETPLTEMILGSSAR